MREFFRDRHQRNAVFATIVLLLAALALYLILKPDSVEPPPITYSGEEARDEAEALVRKGADLQTCLDALAQKTAVNQTVGTEGGQRIFLRVCLAGATGDKALFCKGVPDARNVGASLRWREAQCLKLKLDKNSTCLRHLNEAVDFCNR